MIIGYQPEKTRVTQLSLIHISNTEKGAEYYWNANKESAQDVYKRQLPGFQYGGMEHTGATLYNDNQMFLSEHPTPDEELRRTELIACLLYTSRCV